MKCFHCAAETEQRMTNHIVDLGDCIIIVRHVPSFVCPECGEVMYAAPVAKQLERYVTTAKAAMSELSVINYQDISA